MPRIATIDGIGASVARAASTPSASASRAEARAAARADVAEGWRLRLQQVIEQAGYARSVLDRETASLEALAAAEEFAAASVLADLASDRAASWSAFVRAQWAGDAEGMLRLRRRIDQSATMDRAVYAAYLQRMRRVRIPAGGYSAQELTRRAGMARAALLRDAGG